jgi:hypothetical protein
MSAAQATERQPRVPVAATLPPTCSFCEERPATVRVRLDRDRTSGYVRVCPPCREEWSAVLAAMHNYPTWKHVPTLALRRKMKAAA